jgi:hypothetical protein
VRGDGTGWGPLPDRGGTVEQIRVLYHTTEGKSLPGYRNGKDAPHTTYNPSTRNWFQHGEHHRRMGTMIGSRTTGVLGNEITVQTEIIAYSDKRQAERDGGLWVGDFTDEHYADLAAHIQWCRGNLFVPHLTLTAAYGPADDFETFVYGLDDPREMDDEEWLDAGGILTAHGAGPGQLHWDTGELNLWRIIRESQGNVVRQPDPLAEIETQALKLLALIRDAK